MLLNHWCEAEPPRMPGKLSDSRHTNLVLFSFKKKKKNLYNLLCGTCIARAPSEGVVSGAE